jgi:ribosomal protein L20A (L18A)
MYTSKEPYKYPEIQKLNSKHRTIMYLILAGKSQKDILKESDIGMSQFIRIKKSQIFIDELNAMQEELRQEAIKQLAYKETDPVMQVIREGCLPAAKKMVGLLESKDEHVSQTSASELLNRGNYSPKQAGIDNRVLNVILQGKSAENIERALEDIGSESRTVRQLKAGSTK